VGTLIVHPKCLPQGNLHDGHFQIFGLVSRAKIIELRMNFLIENYKNKNFNMNQCTFTILGIVFRKILNRPKEMNAVSTKVLLLFFPPVCPFAPSRLFSSDTQACFARITSYNIACFALVTSHNMPSNMLHTPLYP